MGKKKRLFYLEFIRAISMIMVVTYHFYVHFEQNSIRSPMCFSDDRIGRIGVTMFFMISGASLMYNYGDKINFKEYAKKRFLGVYPMFWIAYLLVFIYTFLEAKQLIWNLPLYKLIITAFAMDGYLNVYTETFYLIGEWFLGCIILIYILFPLLKMAVNKCPKTFLIISTIINFSIFMLYSGKRPINANLIVCTYSFLLGMYAIKYFKKFKLKQIIIALVLLVILLCIPTKDTNIKVLLANIIGYILFIVLQYIGQKLQNSTIQKVFNIASKYSYAIFLVHHYVIIKIECEFANRNLTIAETIVLYISCWLVISICSKILYEINKNVRNLFSKNEKSISY